MWEAGSEMAFKRRSRLAPDGGFTLLELLVVVAIMALATAGVGLALRDSAQTRIEREAQRLAALLEAARSQSRASGEPVTWHATPQGFRFDGLPSAALPAQWLDASTHVTGPGHLQLGPEPFIGRQQVTLIHPQQPDQAWRVGTDGLRPFAATPQAAGAAPP